MHPPKPKTIHRIRARLEPCPIAAQSPSPNAASLTEPPVHAEIQQLQALETEALHERILASHEEELRRLAHPNAIETNWRAARNA